MLIIARTSSMDEFCCERAENIEPFLNCEPSFFTFPFCVIWIFWTHYEWKVNLAYKCLFRLKLLSNSKRWSHSLHSDFLYVDNTKWEGKKQQQLTSGGFFLRLSWKASLMHWECFEYNFDLVHPITNGSITTRNQWEHIFKLTAMYVHSGGKNTGVLHFYLYSFVHFIHKSVSCVPSKFKRGKVANREARI